MSLIKTFMDAFKKASTPKDAGALEHARSDGLLGPTSEAAAGSFEPIGGGSKPGGGGAIPSNEQPPSGGTDGPNGGQQAPSTPTISDGGPIEGGSGGTSTPPSAPFDPVGVRFPNQKLELEGGGLDSKGLKIEEIKLSGLADAPVAPPEAPLTEVAQPVEARDVFAKIGDVKGESVDDRIREMPGSGSDTLGSSDPEEGGEVSSAARGRISDFQFTHQVDKASPALAAETHGVPGGTSQIGSNFDVKIEEVMTPSGPGGIPVPYPNADGSEGDGEGAAEWLARKAGKGQQEFLQVKMQEAFITREAPAGNPADGAGEHPASALGSRTEVKDAHDRMAEFEDDDFDDDDLLDADDEPSSTLLDLKPDTDSVEMLPGLAGELPDDLVIDDLDFDADADVDADTDESEL